MENIIRIRSNDTLLHVVVHSKAASASGSNTVAPNKKPRPQLKESRCQNAAAIDGLFEADLRILAKFKRAQRKLVQTRA
jgi:hypothetical protein